jgi:hypothetical protein
LQALKGKMRVLSANGSIVAERDLNWLYGGFPHSETNNFPLQGFFGRLPLGKYRLIIATMAGVPELKGARQELIVRYDLIHERSIASVFRTLGIVLLVITCAAGTGFLLLLKR